MSSEHWTSRSSTTIKNLFLTCAGHHAALGALETPIDIRKAKRDGYDQEPSSNERASPLRRP